MEIRILVRDELPVKYGRFAYLCESPAEESGYIIVVDPDFFKLTPECQEFIYWHELGHLKAPGDLTSFQAYFDAEHSCDMNAVAHMGYDATIKGIKELSSFIDEDDTLVIMECVIRTQMIRDAKAKNNPAA